MSVTEMRLIDADELYERMLVRMVMTAYQSTALSVIDLAPTIRTKSVKYFDEDEKVWKQGEVIVSE
jgi:hypothetical protein